MATPLAVGALIIAVIIATLLLWRTNEGAVRGAVSLGERLRLVFGLIFLALAAYHLIRSGNPLYIGAAVIGFGFLTAWLLVERPWDEVI